MFIALDENNKRVSIEEAIKGNKYFCPVCKAPVIVREGLLNLKHYAHQVGECSDDWNYDMSEWHRHMQEYFPVESREVTLSHCGKIHRADVLINDVVIEFQHSPISISEYADRINFFTSLGYRLVWVFDVNDQFVNDSLFFSSDENQWLMSWKNPMRIFSAGPYPNDNLKNFAIWLYWEDEEYPDTLYKVIWCVNECGKPSFKRLVVSDRSIILSEPFDINEFFWSKKDYLKSAIAELKQKYSYAVKYIGKKGEPRSSYICPKTGEFGIKLSSEKGCVYCRHCYMYAEKIRPEGKMWAVYCCYPTQVREVIEIHPGYDCIDAPKFEI